MTLRSIVLSDMCMEHFRLRLAGVPLAVNCHYYSTKEYCKKYFTDDEPVCTVTVTQEDMERERSMMDTRPGDAYLERLALYRKVCETLCAHNIFLIHGSAVAVDGETYIFIAPSGTGKSTHTALWRKALTDSHEVVMVNDDKPLIKVTAAGVFACGTPWSGTYRRDTDVRLPVRAFFLLQRDTENHIEPLARDRIFAELYQRVYFPQHADGTQRVLTMLGQVMRSVHFWSLGCNMTEEAALTAYRAMKKEGDEI